jgi:hypothetical protein
MRWTRRSLVYVAGYLLLGGLALAVAPGWALDLLGSNHDYGDVMPRALGIVMLALGVLVAQIVRHRLEVLYPTTFYARVGIAAGLFSLWLASDDLAFLTVFAIVAAGLVMTATAYRLDRVAARPFGKVGRRLDEVETR